MNNREPVPAVEATIKLGAGISVDGYMLSTGEFRYSLEYIGVLMGHSRNYYGRLLKLRDTKNEPKFLESLLNKGFTGYQIPVKTLREGKRGASIAKTICFDDFCLIVEAEAGRSNQKALAILTASFRELLRSRTHEAFGLPEDSLENRQEQFRVNYEAYLEREEALAESRYDVESTTLPGDELYYPQYQDWKDEKDDVYWYYWETA